MSDTPSSLARRRHTWENGHAEILTRSLKEEAVHLSEYDGQRDSTERIGHFIVQIYNEKRPHPVLGYMTPVEIEHQRLP